MGFTAVLAPAESVAESDLPPGCTLVGVRTLGELLDALFD
jgi:hypothetical protein